jgi:hypothetical protein
MLYHNGSSNEQELSKRLSLRVSRSNGWWIGKVNSSGEEYHIELGMLNGKLKEWRQHRYHCLPSLTEWKATLVRKFVVKKEGGEDRMDKGNI